MKKFGFLLLLSAFSITACLKVDLSPEEQHADDLKKIQKYVADNKLNAKSTASGLHYVIQTEGAGVNPALNSTVTVYYKGYYLDGKVFDESLSKAASFPLRNLIPGWQEGLQLFKKGTKGILILPSSLGYGSNPPSGIRKNAVLVFEIELVNF
jgi:FKBP-type peptidyl-prolyl cis-trans isomerase FkpA